MSLTQSSEELWARHKPERLETSGSRLVHLWNSPARVRSSVTQQNFTFCVRYKSRVFVGGQTEDERGLIKTNCAVTSNESCPTLSSSWLSVPIAELTLPASPHPLSCWTPENNDARLLLLLLLCLLASSCATDKKCVGRPALCGFTLLTFSVQLD